LSVEYPAGQSLGGLLLTVSASSPACSVLDSDLTGRNTRSSREGGGIRLEFLYAVSKGSGSTVLFTDWIRHGGNGSQ
jgi:hypothetical protein